MRIVIIGAGNVGTALAVLLHRAGHKIIGIVSRTEASAAHAAVNVQAPYSTDPLDFTPFADIIFLTTPDRVIADVCQQISISKGFAPQSVVIHTSGAHSSVLLHSASTCGAYPLSFHPLQTFANPSAGIDNLPGSFITIEGNDQALPIGRQLVQDLQCKLLEIPTEGKVLYHTAAVIACNYFTTLIDSALQTLEASGINREDGLHALYPLIEGTLRNIMRVGTTQALTGPIARGDVATVETHLAHIKEQIPAMISLYSLLGQATLDIATAKGTLAPQEKQTLEKLFGGRV